MVRTHRSRRGWQLAGPVTLMIAAGLSGRARADADREGRAAGAERPPRDTSEQTASAASDDDVATARALYVDGIRLVRQADWGEALSAFERSSRLRPHPLTTYNIGACERALGRYTRARDRLQAALRDNGDGDALPPSIVADARGFLSEIERLLVRITIQIEPSGAGLAMDGRPVAPVEDASGRKVFVAGLLPPAPSAPTPRGALDVVADPGAHIITLSRKGYSDAVVNRTYSPGQRVVLRLELERLPATIRVASNQPDALVTVNGRDVGPAPVDVLRPAGFYRVEVSKTSFVPYTADVRVNAGEEATLRARLVPETTPLTKQWWFWTAAAVVVSGAALGTFLATRAEQTAQRPPLDGGTLGWVAPAR